jgi:peptidoglycan/LPS O-acetylase OafA/YrhL
MTEPKSNNFDLIRLAAALQVALHHTLEHLHIGATEAGALVDLFPGVPVFFFVSGFLISRSFERNQAPKEFAFNRMLRIYPALAVCFAASVLMVWATGYLRSVETSLHEWILWGAAQLSFVQFYNPQFMRGFGVGVLNGSLWTISVELQFYAMVPTIYGLLRLTRLSKKASNCWLVVLIVVFLIINRVYIIEALNHSEHLFYKLAGVSFAPWFFMFLVGVLAQRNSAVLVPLAVSHAGLIWIAYLAMALGGRLLGWGMGNGIHPLLFVALSTLVLATAFSHPGTSDRMLGRNDISYGVYIYHMPVINCVLVLGLPARSQIAAITTIVICTVMLAILSWRLVERPALALKRHPLYRHESPRGGSAGLG